MSERDFSPRTDEETPVGFAWVLWVLGWQWIVGSVLLVPPALWFGGLTAAAIAAGFVLLSSLLVAWLASEYTRALKTSQRQEQASLADTARGVISSH